jgi:hypothetical protein
MNLEPDNDNEAEDGSWIMAVLCIGCGVLTAVALDYVIHAALTAVKGW